MDQDLHDVVCEGLEEESDGSNESNRVFSIAQNARMMKETFEYDVPPEWNFDNMFEYAENHQWMVVFKKMDYCHLRLCDSLLAFHPPESEIFLVSGERRQRMIFTEHHCNHDHETDKEVESVVVEQQLISEFKVFCKINGFKIPQTDSEILRHLNTNYLNNWETYRSILLSN